MLPIRKGPLHLYILIAILGFSSCLPGRKTARKFLEEKNKMAVMVVPPANTFLYYYPFDDSVDPESVDEGTNIENSYFLNDLDIEKATETYTQSLFQNLKLYNLNVFGPDEFDQFLSFEGDKFIFTIAQSEIVESDQPHTDRALIDTILYRQDFLLRRVERNTWFEFVKVDEQSDQSGMQVLYSTFLTADLINGRFRYRALTGEVNYEYRAYLLEEEDIFELNRFAGEGNARYIFEFLMNRYVQINANQSSQPSAWFKYYRSDGSIRRSTDDQRFIILNEQE